MNSSDFKNPCEEAIQAIHSFPIKCILEILPVLRPWAIKPHPDSKATLKVQLQPLLLQKFQYKMHWKGQIQVMLYRIVENKWFSHERFPLPKWTGCILPGIEVQDKKNHWLYTYKKYIHIYIKYIHSYTCTNALVSAIHSNFNETNLNSCSLDCGLAWDMEWYRPVKCLFCCRERGYGRWEITANLRKYIMDD